MINRFTGTEVGLYTKSVDLLINIWLLTSFGRFRMINPDASQVESLVHVSYSVWLAFVVWNRHTWSEVGRYTKLVDIMIVLTFQTQKYFLDDNEYVLGFVESLSYNCWFIGSGLKLSMISHFHIKQIHIIRSRYLHKSS